MRARLRKRRWMQRAIRHPGALRRHYRIPHGKKIPTRLLVRDQHAKGKLGQRVRLALVLRGYYRHR